MAAIGSLWRRAAGRLVGFAEQYERRAITLLLLLLVLDYADRTLIGALGPTLKHDFHLDNVLLGLLGTAFAAVSAIATIPLGILADRVRRTLLLALSVGLWVIAEGAVGAAIGIVMLFGARLFLGIVSAAGGPTTPSMVGDLVPATERGRTLGDIDSGQLFGIGLGFLLPAILLSFTTWRASFWVLAVCGVGLAFAFWRLPEPERTGGEGRRARGDGGGAEEDGERKGSARTSRVQDIVRRQGVRPSPSAMLHRRPTSMNMWDAAVYVLRVRTDVIVLIARSLGDFFFQALGIFAVVFATAWYHLSERDADFVFLVIGIGAVAGVLTIGWVGDVLLRRDWINSRVWLGAVGYLLAPVVIFPAFLTHSLTLAIPLFAAGAFLLAGAGPPLDAVRIDVLVPRLRGRGEAVRTVVRTIAEGCAPLLVGWLSGVLVGGGTRGLDATLLLLLPTLLAGGLISLFALRTYAGDVAAALDSVERVADSGDEAPHDQPPDDRDDADRTPSDRDAADQDAADRDPTDQDTPARA